jgi:hypothetical protein
MEVASPPKARMTGDIWETKAAGFLVRSRLMRVQGFLAKSTTLEQPHGVLKGSVE